MKIDCFFTWIGGPGDTRDKHFFTILVAGIIVRVFGAFYVLKGMEQPLIISLPALAVCSSLVAADKQSSALKFFSKDPLLSNQTLSKVRLSKTNVATD